MVSIPKQVQEFLPGKMGWVATASKSGEPNVTPKGTVRVLDDQHVVFADLFSLKTRANLEQNPRVAVTVIDPTTAQGYQIKGQTELLTSGPLFDEMTAQLAKSPKALPPMHYLVKITVEAVFDQSAGPNAGKQIA
jgi:predicted pyridoxine 5'-phosphate oxidase superfamily flavin-nucleotide-binding protein